MMLKKPILVLLSCFFTISTIFANTNVLNIVYNSDGFAVANVFNSSTSYDIMFIYGKKGRLIYTDMIESIISVKKVDFVNELLMIGYTNVNKSYDNLLIRVDEKGKVLDALVVGDYYYQEIPKLLFRINNIYIVVGLRGYRSYDSMYALFFDGYLRVTDCLVFDFGQEVGITYSDFVGQPSPIGIKVLLKTKDWQDYDVEIMADGKYNLSSKNINVKNIKPSISKYYYQEKEIDL